MIEHDIGIWPQHYDHVRMGDKPFELRKNDRCYQKGDSLVMRVYEPKTRKYLSEQLFPPLHAEVTYVLSASIFGLRDNYVALGTRMFDPKTGKFPPISRVTVDDKMVEHRVKTWPEAYEYVREGLKTFDLRKNDRCYQKGDLLVLMAYDRHAREHLDEDEFPRIYTIVTYVLSGSMFGLQDNYVAMGIRTVDPEQLPDHLVSPLDR